MDKVRVGKAVLKVMGIILLGALGSGLWDAVLRPSLTRVGYGILDISSVGYQSFRGDVYRQIATGSTAIENVDILLILMMFSIGLWLLSVRDVFMRFFSLRKRVRADENFENGKVEEYEPILTSKEIGASMDRWGRPLIYSLAFFLGLTVVLCVVEAARVSYINSASVHYQQVLKIAAPFLSEEDRREVESKFAQIESKGEYEAILYRLAKTAKEHSQRVPAFRPW